jgi:hypothetical protein
MDDMTTLPPSVDETPTTVDDAPTKPKWSRIRIVAVIVAAMLLIGAVVFTVTADQDRSSATHERKHAEQLLATQRSDTQDVEMMLRSTVAGIAAFNQAVATPMATEQNIAALEDQGLTAEQAVQSAGVAGTVDDYNSAIDRSNALVDQYNTALDTLNQQLTALPPLPFYSPPKSV